MTLPSLTVRDLALTFGGKPLFSSLSFNLYRGEKVCLVGRNGCGKSTLLRLLSGMIDHDGGEIFIHPGLKCSYLPQEVILPGYQTPFEYISSKGIDPYVAASYLDQLKVNADGLMQNLSGGERRRIALAHVLAEEGDILLLDEPTNHLDLPAITWLEDVIKAHQGSVIIISHDRSFLEKISNQTYWIHQGKLFVNKKGYADFERWSEEILTEEEREMEKLDVKLKQEQEWLHRGVTARRKRNQRRLHQLFDLRQKKQEIQQGKQGPLKLGASEGDISSRIIIEAQDISKSFGDKRCVSHFSTRILRGDRIGVIGANGSGKTTLLRMLVKQFDPDEGVVKLGPKIDLIYFDQMRDTLKLNETLWQNLCPTGGDQVYVSGTYRHVMGYLKDFLFTEKQIRGVASILSGGEKNRLALAKALAQPSNVLVMDEPTNDLDMDTLDLLTEMLLDYEGTILIVSHDRDFLNKTTTSIISVEGEGVVEEYVGGYDDYLTQRTIKSPLIKKKKQIVSSTNEEKPQARRLSYNQQRLLERLPEIIKTLESEINQIEIKLSDPQFYANHPQEFSTLSARLEEAKKELSSHEETWLELSLVSE